jgi:hypothetical protein
VKYAFKVLDPLALETEEQMMAKISEFDPQYVMMIVQTEARSTTNGYGWNNSLNVGGTFDVQLRDLSGEKILWRASLKTDGGWGIETSVYKAAQKLFDRMVEDRLFN